MTKKHINQEAVRAFFETHKKEIVRTAAGMLVACLVSVGAAALMQPKAYVVSYQRRTDCRAI